MFLRILCVTLCFLFGERLYSASNDDLVERNMSPVSICKVKISVPDDIWSTITFKMNIHTEADSRRKIPLLEKGLEPSTDNSYDLNLFFSQGGFYTPVHGKIKAVFTHVSNASSTRIAVKNILEDLKQKVEEVLDKSASLGEDEVSSLKVVFCLNGDQAVDNGVDQYFLSVVQQD